MKAKLAPIIDELSGSIGNFTFTRSNGCQILGKKPSGNPDILSNPEIVNFKEYKPLWDSASEAVKEAFASLAKRFNTLNLGVKGRMNSFAAAIKSDFDLNEIDSVTTLEKLRVLSAQLKFDVTNYIKKFVPSGFSFLSFSADTKYTNVVLSAVFTDTVVSQIQSVSVSADKITLVDTNATATKENLVFASHYNSSNVIDQVAVAILPGNDLELELPANSPVTGWKVFVLSKVAENFSAPYLHSC